MYLLIYGKSYCCDYFLIPNFDGVNTIGNFKLKRNTSMKHFWDLTVAGKVRGSNELGIGAKMVVQKMVCLGFTVGKAIKMGWEFRHREREHLTMG